MRDKLPYLWIVLLILLGQALLLTFQLADQSLWTDEMYTARIVYSQTVQEAVAKIRLTENRPPLHYLVLWGWARVVGPSEWGMRLVSVAATLLATALTFRLASSLSSPRTALWAALLAATAPTLLWYGRIVRGYTLAVPLALLSTLSFWRAWGSLSFRPKLVYLLTCALLLFTDYATVPVVAAHLLFLGSVGLSRLRASALPVHARSACRRQVRSWLVVGAGLLILGAGLALIFRWQIDSAVAQRTANTLLPTLSDLARLPSRIPLMMAGSLFAFYSFSVGETIFPWHPLAVPGTLAALVLAWLGIRRMWRDRREVAFIGIWSVGIPFVFISLFLFGVVLGPNMLVIAAARCLYLGPWLFILVGAGIEARRGSRFSFFLLAVLLATRGICLLNQTGGRHLLNPVYGVPVRELAAQVARNVQPGDVVIFENPLAFDFYFRQLDTTTPLFTPARHVGHTVDTEARADSPAFLGLEGPFISAIAPERLLSYLQNARPARLWLVVFQHEGTDRTIEHEIGHSLARTESYGLISRVGYAPQDPLYARLRAWWRPRTPIQYKAEILLYIQHGSAEPE
ncbi:MAG: glycosyltransferase family 39 protein [Anaerolineae bacterium]|nr:MAG: glycosyltransferase family 39 protein [Anaerolineae bacterium]